ncbi:MAG TPA: VOC family protein [Lachnospiraceae bacterium]|nr:VOC family protein [Lachnospiraceae bacterium]
MDIVNIDHITINVLSMSESIYFYETVLGLKKDSYILMEDHAIQYFVLSKTTKLELIRYQYETKRQKPACDDRGIYRHFAIEVKDLDKEYQKIAGYANVKITAKPARCEKLFFRNFILEDPNGVEIEIIEREMEKG